MVGRFLRTRPSGCVLGLLTLFGLRSAAAAGSAACCRARSTRLTEALTHKLTLLPNMEEKLRGRYPETMWGPALSAIDEAAMERLLYSGSKGRDNTELTRQRDGLRIANGAIERVTELLRRAEHGRSDAAPAARATPALARCSRCWQPRWCCRDDRAVEP